MNELNERSIDTNDVNDESNYIMNNMKQESMDFFYHFHTK